MISKSKVRRSALLALYAILENGGDPKQLDWELFQNISEEKETDHLRLSLARALEHSFRSTADSARVLELRAALVMEATQGDLTFSSVKDDLERYLKRSNEFDAALATLRYAVKDKRRETTDQVALCNDDVLALADITAKLGEDMLPKFADFPAYKGVLEPLAAIVRRRDKQLAAGAVLRDPAKLAADKEYSGLARQALDLQEGTPAAKKLALAVHERLEEWDSLIAPLLQNYSIQRLDIVDKCILYISLYELKVNHLDVPIVVSEATALAHEFSGGKSAPFIHGVIAAAAKA